MYGVSVEGKGCIGDLGNMWVAIMVRYITLMDLKALVSILIPTGIVVGLLCAKR